VLQLDLIRCLNTRCKAAMIPLPAKWSGPDRISRMAARQDGGPLRRCRMCVRMTTIGLTTEKKLSKSDDHSAGVLCLGLGCS
jgi:hypothetical protein